jgi:hypothetical protein
MTLNYSGHMRVAGAVAAALGMLLWPGCSTDSGAERETGSAASASPAPEASANPSPSVRAVGFNQTYSFDNGLTVKILKIRSAKLGPGETTDDPNAKEGDPYTIISTRIVNGSPTDVKLVITGRATFGPEATEAPTVFVGEESASIDLKPKESQDTSFGFVIPAEFQDQVVMEMTITIDPVRTAVFSGSISQ